MKSITSAEAQNRFGQLIEAAQRRPIAITRHGRPAVVVMSIDDYERTRRRSWQQITDSMRDASAHAKTRGLTAGKLDELLADES